MAMSRMLLLVPFVALQAAARAAPAPQWPLGPSEAFVHLFEWSWDDVAQECEEWLGPKGFTAVQISPPNEHNAGSGWDVRYQPVSYELTSRSGNASQFASMVERCRAVGVGIYADAVFNHQAPYSGVGVGGSHFGYRTYPQYSPLDFHHAPGDSSTNCGVSDYNNIRNVQYCDLLGMPDLCTECEHVQETIAAYLNRMAQLGIAGLRIDAAKNMNATDLGRLLERVNGSLYLFQEVPFGGAVQEQMYYPNGPVAVFGYASTVGPKFVGQGMLRDDLAYVGEGWGLTPSSKAVVFLDNHDTQRSGAPLTYKSGTLYVLANIFMLAHPYGYPKVMSSFHFDWPDQGPPAVPVHGPGGELRCGVGQPWVCEHRHPAIANMVAWRRSAGESPITNFLSGGDTMAFCRGTAACVALNRMGFAWNVTLRVGLQPGEYCDVIRSDSGDCPSVQVRADGTAQLLVPGKSAVAIHAAARKPLV